MAPTLLQSEADFKKFIGDPCGVIIDPMTYRTAELYLLGEREALRHAKMDDAVALFETILSNKSALFAFIDSLVLRKKLPMIAYSLTMHGPEEDPGATPELLKRCNEASKEKEDPVVDIRILDPAYGPLKKDAIETLNAERPPITESLREKILPDLKAFRYRWQPPLGDVEGYDDLSADDQLLMTFLFGRVLFRRYAQAAVADVVLPPKLGRLDVLASLRDDDVRNRMQDRVFAGLKEIALEGRDCLAGVHKVPWAPTFLPHLLAQDPKTPQKLLADAVALRKKWSVKSYRKWFEEMERDFDAGREPTPARLAELAEIRAELKKDVGLSDDAPPEKPEDVPVRARCQIAVAQKGLDLPEVRAGVEVEGEVRPKRLWGWISRQVAGDRYRTVLMDLVRDERRYPDSVDHQLGNIWFGR